jgi:hypothetical protein
LIVHAGTTFSSRLVEGQANSFNVIKGDRQQLSVEFMTWQGSEFQLAERRQFRHNNGVWQQTTGLNSV